MAAMDEPLLPAGIEDLTRELTRGNPEMKARALIQAVQRKSGLTLDPEMKRAVGLVHAEERRRMAAPRERLLGTCMIVLGLASIIYSYFLLGEAGSGLDHPRARINTILYSLVLAVFGALSLAKGVAGLVTGRTSAVSVTDALEKNPLRKE